MKKQSRTVPRRRQSVSPTPRHLPLVDILVDTQAELQELVVASGLKVLEAMLEEDRSAVCGPRYAHQPERQAYRTPVIPPVRWCWAGGRSPSADRAPGAAARRCRCPPRGHLRERGPAEPACRRPDAHWRGDPSVWAESGPARRGYHHAGHEQECGQSTLCRADPGAAGRVAGDAAQPAGPGGSAHRWGAGRRGHCIVVALGIDHTGAKHPPRPLGRGHGECDGLSGTFDESRRVAGSAPTGASW